MNYTPCEQVEIFFSFEQSTSDSLSMQKLNVTVTVRVFVRTFDKASGQPSLNFVYANLFGDLFVKRIIYMIIL